MRRKIYALVLSGLSIGVAGCSSSHPDVRTITRTSTMAATPLSTTSAPEYALPSVTQSSKATSTLAAPQTSQQSAPPPTLMPTSVAASSTSSVDAIGTLSAPSIGLTTPVIPLDSVAGSLTPAPETVAWYSSSAKPGTTGTTLLIGYAADKLAPAQKLVKGADIVIADHHYSVTDTHSDSSTQVPSDSALWGATSDQRLALVIIPKNANEKDRIIIAQSTPAAASSMTSGKTP